MEEDIKTNKDDVDNFYEIATEIQSERIKKRKDEQNSTEHKIKNTYAIFELYCRAFEKDINLETFKTYRKENKINFWIAKKITETYFALKFQFDYKKNKWIEVV